MDYIKMYIIAFIVFLVVDAVWLGLVAPRFYRSQIGHLMMDTPNFAAAGAFYLIYIVGVVYFVINPAIQEQSLQTAIVNGLLFGFFTYATYDLTNLATLRDWPLLVTGVDLAWGTFLGGMIGMLSYLTYNWLF